MYGGFWTMLFVNFVSSGNALQHQAVVDKEQPFAVCHLREHKEAAEGGESFVEDSEPKLDSSVDDKESQDKGKKTRYKRYPFNIYDVANPN